MGVRREQLGDSILAESMVRFNVAGHCAHVYVQTKICRYNCSQPLAVGARAAEPGGQQALAEAAESASAVAPTACCSTHGLRTDAALFAGVGWRKRPCRHRCRYLGQHERADAAFGRGRSSYQAAIDAGKNPIKGTKFNNNVTMEIWNAKKSEWEPVTDTNNVFTINNDPEQYIIGNRIRFMITAKDQTNFMMPELSVKGEATQ